MKKYSVIIPIYNRPDEMDELLESLTLQTYSNFDVWIIEDGSTIDCKEVVQKYEQTLDIKYHFKANSGPGDSRNYGMNKATGEWLIIFDSDCIIPPHYFDAVENGLQEQGIQVFGGPDAAHESFTTVQKAINYAMTSFITTGGIRGKKKTLDTYQPRSFNMGIRKEVFKKVGGFSDVHPGEDPDLSYRIMDAGYKTGLIEDAYVYHKRRIDFQKFTKQVYKFGVVRNILMKWHPGRTNLVYFFPALFLVGSIFLITNTFLGFSWIIAPLEFLAIVLFIDAFIKTKNIIVTILAVPASFIQLYAYGYGFIKAYWILHVLKKDERKALPGFFFKK